MWRSTEERPTFPTRLKKPNWKGIEPNFKERYMWVWLYHKKDGVKPALLVERRYDNKYETGVMVEGDDFSFERYSHWHKLDFPSPPQAPLIHQNKETR